MPTRAMEQQRHHMPPFHLTADSESSFSRQRPVGPFRQEPCHENVERFSLISGSKSVASSPVHMLRPAGVDQLELMEPHNLMDQKTPFGEHKLLGQHRHANLPPTLWRPDQDTVQQHDSKPLALFPNVRKGHLSMTHYENGLFSSSLPDIFDKKLRLTPKNGLVGQPVGKELNHDDDEPFELTQEIEAQVIGNLLPDDDDLLSGVLDNVGYPALANNRDDIDDDIFSTGGGLELEADENNKLLKLNGGGNNGQSRLNGLLYGETSYGEHPSRTLFVRNMNSNVEDSKLKLLFEQYGDIQRLYTAYKHHGFVMISYYDIRSAEHAMKALQSKQFRHWKLDIHYSIPKENPLEKDNNQGTLAVINLDPSVTNDDLQHIFGGYGEIKEIHETSQKSCYKSIEFYDSRAAEAAFYALNMRDIAGKKIKLEPCCLGDNKRLMQQRPPVLEQEEFGACRLGNANSLPSTHYGSVNMASMTSTGHEHGITRVLRSRVQPSINQFREGTFLDGLSSTRQNISSPVRIATAGTHNNQSALGEHGHSLGKMNGHLNYGFQGNGAFNPHSLPEFHTGQSNGIPYNLSTIPPIGVKSNSRTAEGIDNRHLYKVGCAKLGGHSSGHSEALGFSRTGSCPLHGHQVAWNNTNNSQHHTSSPMLWPNTGPFINNIPARPPAQVHGISRASRMPENSLAASHHVGSAPAVNPSIWDRRNGYAGELMEAPSFHPGSVGSMGFSDSPRLHQLELTGMFPQNGGNPAMSPGHVSGRSHQRGHMFHGRSHIGPLPSSFDSPGERTRSRRNESCSNQSDNKRQYELDVERIVCGEDSRTTLMIKNIPNKYTSKMLLTAIDENHKGTYDFIYLPIDFKNKCNVGYAFINMISPEHIVPFYKIFHGKRWEKFNSEKVASLAYARIQGKSSLIAHFQNSSLMNEDKRCRPILFHSDGPNAGDQEPFPVGTHIRSRPGRSRILSCEESHRDILSTSANSWTPSNGGSHSSGYPKDADPTMA
ncbi:protein MEI2-like 4 [Lolium rigidum]|uniref:protein MEI2-like 4 n=1 Tax=Lolium rigidum TaxID=89674 RepID=UPI001F5DEC3F|nr:protein MEI2-like 4 [Lolium rigidum]